MSERALFDDLTVSRETIDRLEDYLRILEKWNRSINLVATSTLADAWARHVLDSAQIFPHLPEECGNCVDFGSGAGFPGLVLAMLAVEKRPDMSVTLIESDRRKATFLREVIRATGASAAVTTQRVEAWEGTADVVTARGFAPLVDILALAKPVLSARGVLLLNKGARYESELTDASKHWHMDVERIESRIDPASMLLKITGFEERQRKT